MLCCSFTLNELQCFLGVCLIGWKLGLNFLSSSCFLFLLFPCLHLFTFGFIPSSSLSSSPLHLPMQPYYHSGSFPEFLLSLLSSWRPSAKKRPAVSYGCSGLHRASSVCASSFLLCASLSPPLHATSLLSAMLGPQPLCVLLVTVTRQRAGTKSHYLQNCFTLWFDLILNRHIYFKFRQLG